MLRRFQPIVSGPATAAVAPHRAIAMGLLCVSAQRRLLSTSGQSTGAAAAANAAGTANPAMKSESAAGSSAAPSSGVELNKHWTELQSSMQAQWSSWTATAPNTANTSETGSDQPKEKPSAASDGKDSSSATAGTPSFQEKVFETVSAAGSSAATTATAAVSEAAQTASARVAEGVKATSETVAPHAETAKNRFILAAVVTRGFGYWGTIKKGLTLVGILGGFSSTVRRWIWWASWRSAQVFFMSLPIPVRIALVVGVTVAIWYVATVGQVWWTETGLPLANTVKTKATEWIDAQRKHFE